jgi:hypothetical protein
MRKSDVVLTKSISNVASNQAMSWMIGSKPNANSNPECFAARRPASNEIRSVCEPADQSVGFRLILVEATVSRRF